MFEVWGTGPPTAARFAQASTLDAPLSKLDDECRRRHEQGAAADEGVGEIHNHFEVRDQAGSVPARLTYSPDVSRPYEGLIVDEMLWDAA